MWISIQTLVPENAIDVLCYCDQANCPCGNFLIASLIDGNWKDGFHSKEHHITHWMYLPNRPDIIVNNKELNDWVKAFKELANQLTRLEAQLLEINDSKNAGLIGRIRDSSARLEVTSKWLQHKIL